MRSFFQEEAIASWNRIASQTKDRAISTEGVKLDHSSTRIIYSARYATPGPQLSKPLNFALYFFSIKTQSFCQHLKNRSSLSVLPIMAILIKAPFLLFTLIGIWGQVGNTVCRNLQIQDFYHKTLVTSSGKFSSLTLPIWLICKSHLYSQQYEVLNTLISHWKQMDIVVHTLANPSLDWPNIMNGQSQTRSESSKILMK